LFELMAPHMSVKIFSPGDVIIHEGDEGDCMFFMYSGEVEVLIGHKDKEKQVATLGVGSLFGEMAVFGNGIREATVRALKICGCHIIYDKDLHDCLKGFPTERVHLHMLASLRQSEINKNRSSERQSFPMMPSLSAPGSRAGTKQRSTLTKGAIEYPTLETVLACEAGIENESVKSPAESHAIIIDGAFLSLTHLPEGHETTSYQSMTPQASHKQPGTGRRSTFDAPEVPKQVRERSGSVDVQAVELPQIRRRRASAPDALSHASVKDLLPMSPATKRPHVYTPRSPESKEVGRQATSAGSSQVSNENHSSDAQAAELSQTPPDASRGTSHVVQPISPPKSAQPADKKRPNRGRRFSDASVDTSAQSSTRRSSDVPADWPLQISTKTVFRRNSHTVRSSRTLPDQIT